MRRAAPTRGALDAGSGGALDAGSGGAPVPPPAPPPAAVDGNGKTHRPTSPVIAVLIEPGRPQVAAELLGAAARLGHEAGAVVHALVPIDTAGTLPATPGADRVVALVGSCVAEDVGDAVVAYVRVACPWAVLAPSTAFGREVAGRAAAATGSGLSAMRSPCRHAPACWWPPSRPSPVRWWRTSRAAARPRWSPYGRASCLLAPEAATPRPVPPSTQRVVGTRGAYASSPNVTTTTSRPWPGPRSSIGVGAGVEPEEYGLLSPLAAAPGRRARGHPQGDGSGAGPRGPARSASRAGPSRPASTSDWGSAGSSTTPWASAPPGRSWR